MQFLISHLHTSHQPPRKQQLQYAVLGVLSAVFEMIDSVSGRDSGGQTGHHKGMEAPAT